PRNILDENEGRSLGDGSLRAVQLHGVEGGVAAGQPDAAEPNFVFFWGPLQIAKRPPSAGENPFLAMQVHYSYGEVSGAGVILEECNRVSLAGDAHSQRRASLVFVQHGSDGILDAIAARQRAGDHQVRAVRRPIRVVHILQNLARRSAGEWNA